MPRTVDTPLSPFPGLRQVQTEQALIGQNGL
jgi:hypothetical protein